MSEEKKVSDQNDQISDEVEKKDSVAYATYSKLLSEKKKRDQENSEMRAKLEEIEQQKLEAQGQFKEQNELLKKQLAAAKAENAETHKKFGMKALKWDFDQIAKDAGCVKTDDLYRLIDLSEVEIGEDYTFNREQLTSLIVGQQKERDYLFKKDVAKVKDAVPNGKTNNVSSDIFQMKTDELKELLAKKLG